MRRKRDAMRENLEKYGEVFAGSILLSLGIWLFVTPNGLNFGGCNWYITDYRSFCKKISTNP